MARSYYYNDQKLNQFIQPMIKKYYNYTHQKLVEEEITTKNKIENISNKIKGTEANIKETDEILSKLNGLLSDLKYKNSQEEQNSKNQIRSKGNLF